MFIGSMHFFSVSLLLGSKITFTNACLIALVDCFPNIWACVKILKQNQGDYELDINSDNEGLKCLTLVEFLKTGIPLIYIFTFLIAYFGPNAKVLGNVQNDYWQYEQVTDVSDKFTRIAMFFTFDVGKVFTFGILLCNNCRLNMYESLCRTIHQHGISILMYIIGCLTVVICCYLMNFNVCIHN